MSLFSKDAPEFQRNLKLHEVLRLHFMVRQHKTSVTAAKSLELNSPSSNSSKVNFLEKSSQFCFCSKFCLAAVYIAEC